MAKAITLGQTYTVTDATSVGWRVTWHGGRLMAQKRSQWQGSRNAARLLIGHMSLSDAREWVASTRGDDPSYPGLDIELEARLADGDGVSHPGYVVR